MDELEIRVRPIEKKAQRAKLPRRINKNYPPGLPAIFITPPLLAALRSFASSDLDYELGGVLVGRYGRSSRRLFIHLDDYIPASKGISRRASFEFTNEAQQEIHEVMQTRFKELHVVGWFHTHPGYGIFLSSADEFIDRNYFREAYHIAVVIDPRRAEIEVGAFVWDAERNRVRVPLFEL